MRPTLPVLQRSAWKVPFVVRLPLKEAKQNKTPIRTNARACTILPSFVGIKFQVHNGQHYKEFTVVEDMVGRKLGEFAHTRKSLRDQPAKKKKR